MIGRHQRRNIAAARELRTRETQAEDLLWKALRDRRLDGFKFRRQHPVGPFVLDFCCVERRLGIEVDGEIHDSQRERDTEREALLTATGYHLLRIPNAEVQNEFHRVVARIRAALRETPSSRPGSPGHAPRQ